MESKVSYTLVVYAKDGEEVFTLREKFPGEKLETAKALGKVYNKQGYDFYIYKEELTPVCYVLSKDKKVEL